MLLMRSLSRHVEASPTVSHLPLATGATQTPKFDELWVRMAVCFFAVPRARALANLPVGLYYRGQMPKTMTLGPNEALRFCFSASYSGPIRLLIGFKQGRIHHEGPHLPH